MDHSVCVRGEARLTQVLCVVRGQPLNFALGAGAPRVSFRIRQKGTQPVGISEREDRKGYRIS